MNEKTYVNRVKLRLVREASVKYESKLDEPEKIARIAYKYTRDLAQECVMVFCFNTAMDLINYSVVSLGTVNSSLISVGEIMKIALLSNATGIVILHNHPSGKLRPSDSDIDATNRIAKASSLLGLTLHDHLIVGE